MNAESSQLIQSEMNQSTFVYLIALFFLLCPAKSQNQVQGGQDDVIKIPKITDFQVNGSGDHPNWGNADWVVVPQRLVAGENMRTQFKALYSDQGLYFLFECEDRVLTSTLREDFLDLWTEDVVEVFLWPDSTYPIYFEYEITPMNFELPILVPNDDGNFMGWRPWKYTGNRKVQHFTSVRGGEKKGGSTIDSWTAEFFIPYELLKPLGNVPPSSGMEWRANFYRMDYDNNNERSSWAWNPVEKSFHEFEKYGTIRFE